MRRGGEERKTEKPPCPLTQRVCLSASITDGASECALTTLMTDISLTLESICPHGKEQRRRRLLETERNNTIHLMPDHSVMTQSLLYLLVGNTHQCRKQL